MFVTDLYLSIILGLVIGLLFVEITGISPGGLIVPGYLALVFDSPVTVILVFFIAFLTYLIVKHILPKFVILYGRRRFTTVIITATLLKILFEFLFPLLPFAVFEFRGIGFIVPALIANCILKQGVKLTTLSTLGITALVFIGLNVSYLL